MGIYIKGDFKNSYPHCDECIFGELIRCEATTRREVYDYEVDCPLSKIEVVRCEDCVWRDKDNQGEDYCTYAKGLADIGEESFCSWGNRIKK